MLRLLRALLGGLTLVVVLGCGEGKPKTPDSAPKEDHGKAPKPPPPTVKPPGK